MIRPSGWLRTALCASVLAFALSGCSTGGTLAPPVSLDLQNVTRAIAERVAAGDAAAALGQLDALQARLDQALADGGVTEERKASIQTRIDAVRADLAASLTPALTPAPAPAPTTLPQPKEDVGTKAPGNPNKGPGNNNGKDKKGAND